MTDGRHAPGRECPDVPGLAEDLGHSAVRDAACAARRSRQKAARERARRQRRTLLVSVLALAVLAAGWRAFHPGSIAAVTEALPRPTNPSLFSAASDHSEPEGPATPLFATYRSLQLHLPVAEEDLTELAFHQASGSNALPMASLLPDAEPSTASGKRGTGRTVAEPDPDAGEPGILGGEVIRMWRSNRTGQPDTAADVGAPAGAPVFAPVSGIVVEVKPYLLYGTHEDLEIHIQPAGWPEIDLVLIHVSDVTVEPGDLVVGGVSRIASVRLLSDRVNHQIADYSPCAGDHVHVQLNRVEEPGATVGPGES